jgi:hypothetical protein
MAHDIDIAIDRAARRLTQADPPADLTPRVLARLGDRRSRWRHWTFAPLASLGAAVITAGITLLPDTLSIGDLPSPVPVVASAPPWATGHSVMAASLAAVDVPAWRGRSRVPAPAQAVMTWRSRVVPALDTPDALGVEAIQPELLSISQLTVKVMGPPPIEIPPIPNGPER